MSMFVLICLTRPGHAGHILTTGVSVGVGLVHVTHRINCKTQSRCSLQNAATVRLGALKTMSPDPSKQPEHRLLRHLFSSSRPGFVVGESGLMKLETTIPSLITITERDNEVANTKKQIFIQLNEF